MINDRDVPAGIHVESGQGQAIQKIQDVPGPTPVVELRLP
jgi:hypothetical protein